MIDIDMINKIEEWGFVIEKEYLGQVSYKLYQVDAIKLIMFNEYLGEEFEKYLKDNDIKLDNWWPLDVEEFFEQYGIELF